MIFAVYDTYLFIQITYVHFTNTKFHVDAANVIPVLVSAAFLQMDPLLNDCLQFCQEHMNEILRQATNLSCLNDSIITR